VDGEQGTTKRSRRDVIRFGAAAAGIAWVAPVIVALDASPASASPLSCCHSDGNPSGCGLSFVAFQLSNGATCYPVKFDFDGSKFSCGTFATGNCTNVVAGSASCPSGSVSGSCPSGLTAALSATINADGSVTINFPDSYTVTAFQVHQGRCCLAGVPGHNAVKDDANGTPLSCHYDVGTSTGKGSTASTITFPPSRNTSSCS
jgi:hypothetical protein